MEDMALERDSSDVSSNSLYGKIVDCSSAGAKKDDYYVVIANGSDDEDKDTGKDAGGMVREAEDNPAAGNQAKHDLSGEKSDDDFVIMYADDDGGDAGDDMEVVEDRDTQAELSGQANGLEGVGTTSSSTGVNSGNYSTIVAMLDNTASPVLPASVAAEQSAITTVTPFPALPTDGGMNYSVVPQPNVFSSPDTQSGTGLAAQVTAADSSANCDAAVSGIVETNGSAQEQNLTTSAADVTAPDAPEGFEEGEPVDNNAATFLSQVRFFAGRTWAMRGEKLKENGQKSIPADLISTDESDLERRSNVGSPHSNRGRGRGRGRGLSLRGRGRGRGAGRGNTASTKSLSANPASSPAPPSARARGGRGVRLRGRGRGRGVASSVGKKTLPAGSSDPSDDESDTNSQDESATSGKGVSPKTRGTGGARGRLKDILSQRARGKLFRGRSRGRGARGVNSSPRSLRTLREKSATPSASPVMKGAVGTRKRGRPKSASSATPAKTGENKLPGLSSPYSPLHTRSSGTSSNALSHHTRSSGNVSSSESGISSSSVAKKRKLAGGSKGGSSERSLTPDKRTAASSVDSSIVSGTNSRDISPVVKLVKLTSTETGWQSSSPDRHGTKRSHDKDDAGISKRARMSHGSRGLSEGPDKKPDSLTKSLGGVMSYLFGENLVGQCPDGFTVNVKLEVEKKKDGACASSSHAGCQCHSPKRCDPEECPCLGKLSNSQLAAVLRRQVEKRRDMTIKTRAKILATITHLIQELDST